MSVCSFRRFCAQSKRAVLRQSSRVVRSMRRSYPPLPVSYGLRMGKGKTENTQNKKTEFVWAGCGGGGGPNAHERRAGSADRPEALQRRGSFAPCPVSSERQQKLIATTSSLAMLFVYLFAVDTDRTPLRRVGTVVVAQLLCGRPNDHLCQSVGGEKIETKIRMSTLRPVHGAQGARIRNKSRNGTRKA